MILFDKVGFSRRILGSSNGPMRGDNSSGFTFVESLVVVAIISILTTMSVVAIPSLRAHQDLVADTETIRALLLDAKQRTLNQVRPEKCLDSLEVDLEDILRAPCSDVGVAIDQDKREIIEFADTSTAGVYKDKYDGERANEPGSGDYVITRSRLATNLDEGSTKSLLFVGVPPSAQLYKDGGSMSASSTATIKLTSNRGTTRTITVYSFGTIDVE